jgi:hypothetical protein
LFRIFLENQRIIVEFQAKIRKFQQTFPVIVFGYQGHAQTDKSFERAFRIRFDSVNKIAGIKAGNLTRYPAHLKPVRANISSQTGAYVL